MRLFKCQSCGERLYFENRNCGSCGRTVGYFPEAKKVIAMDPGENNTWTAAGNLGESYSFCTNAAQDACNWLITVASEEKFCACCRYNRTLPNLADVNNLVLWRRMEAAKHRLFYTLFNFNLPLANRIENPETGLAFDFLADPADGHGSHVMTGHDDGLVTIALKEADDAAREKLRTELEEPYRTLLGHFRHEIGHYFWDKLVRDGDHVAAFREAFGDESLSYEEALRNHYNNGPPPNWQETYISAYATMHPWEDFAETWAHYLHIVDTLETASSYGLQIHPPTTGQEDLNAEINFDPHTVRDLKILLDAWFPLTFAMNSLNRSMGLPDVYPFVLSLPIIAKLQYVHDLIHNRQPE